MLERIDHGETLPCTELAKQSPRADSCPDQNSQDHARHDDEHYRQQNNPLNLNVPERAVSSSRVWTCGAMRRDLVRRLSLLLSGDVKIDEATVAAVNVLPVPTAAFGAAASRSTRPAQLR